MEIETLSGINGGMFPSLLLLLLKVIALITIFPLLQVLSFTSPVLL